MKRYKVIQTNEIDRIECDWCKVEVKKNSLMFAVNDFSLKWRLGKREKDGFIYLTDYEVDLCHNCRNKLMTMIKKQGININVSDHKRRPNNELYIDDDLNLQAPSDL